MNTDNIHSHQQEHALQTAIAAVRRGRENGDLTPGDESGDPRFVTISREAGIDGHAVAGVLASRLNLRLRDPDGPRWVVWDRHRLESVARDKTAGEVLDEALSESASTWFLQFFSGLGVGHGAREAEESALERKMALLVRALARAGNAIIIGRAGVYATQDLPGGIHVRLVAPLARRIADAVRAMRIPTQAAAEEVRRVDRERNATHRRFCTGRALQAEHFSVTLNTAIVTPACAAQCVQLIIAEAEESARAPAASPSAVAS